MNAKEYLEQIKKIDTLIKNKKVEIGRYEQQTLDVALSITAGGQTVTIRNPKTHEPETHAVERVKSSSGGNSFANAVVNNVDAISRLEKQIKNYEACRNDIISVIESLPEDKYDVLHMVYVQYLTYSEAALKRNCSKSTIKNTHGAALADLERNSGHKFRRFVQ